MRDAVEHRLPPPALATGGNFDHEALWLGQIKPPAIRREDNSPSIVCHFEAEAVYREEPFNLQPQSIPMHKCTHLVYVGAGIGEFFFFL